MVDPHPDLTGITLKVLFIGGLLVACFWIVQPFLPAIIWAMTLVIATWPLMLWVQKHAGNRRSVAVAVMTLTLLLVLIVPAWLAISTVVANVEHIGEMFRTLLSLQIPAPPLWLAAIPLIGEPATKAWRTLASTSAGTGSKVETLRRGFDEMVCVHGRESRGHVRSFSADDLVHSDHV